MGALSGLDHSTRLNRIRFTHVVVPPSGPIRSAPPLAGWRCPSYANGSLLRLNTSLTTCGACGHKIKVTVKRSGPDNKQLADSEAARCSESSTLDT